MRTHSAVLVLLCSILPGSAFAWDKAALADNIREAYHIPGDVDVAISDPKPSEVPGFDVAEVRMERGEAKQADKIYLSKDGKHYLMGSFRDASVSPDQERLAQMDLKDSATRGPAKAPVTVVQYTDFQCPYCQRGFEIMRSKVMKDFPTQVRWVYKSLPLTSIHPWAEPAAIAAECAKDQSSAKFWLLHDALFEKQREINVSNVDQKIRELSKSAKVDEKPFLACIDAKKTLPFIRRDLKEAEAMGVSGTPAFIINGHLVPGADYDIIKQVIEEALKGKHGKT